METIIKVSPSELNLKLLNKIRDFIGNKENIDVTISFKEVSSEQRDAYSESLNRSVQQAEDQNKLISFTMEDFMAYSPKSDA